MGVKNGVTFSSTAFAGKWCFNGYLRADGRVGVRDHVLIMSTVRCTGVVQQKIAAAVPHGVDIMHPWCFPARHASRVLRNVALNPNVAAVLIIGLDCEGLDRKTLAESIVAEGKPCAFLDIRDSGGSLKTIGRGIIKARELYHQACAIGRRLGDMSDLVVGVKCGGSDSTSGLSANPAVGYAVDRLIDEGATVIFSEGLECVGAESVLCSRARSPEVAQDCLNLIRMTLEFDNSRPEVETQSILPVRKRLISPGNIRGGLTTLEEKSLGAVCKTGSRPISGVIGYGERPPGPGLWMMDGMNVEESDGGVLTGFVAAGAQVILFTTGRGSVMGSAVSPVVKITGNPETFALMEDNMDINAGDIITGTRSIEEVGDEIVEIVRAVCQGSRTKAEVLGHNDFEITGVIT